MPEENSNALQVSPEPMELVMSASDPVTPENPKKKFSSAYITAVIALAILALAGIGFGVYAWFFRPADGASSVSQTVFVNNGASGGGKSSSISIIDENVFRIVDRSESSAVDGKSEVLSDETYYISSMGADGPADAIRLMSKKSESGFAGATNASLMFYILLGLDDEQFKKVLDFAAEIEYDAAKTR